MRKCSAPLPDADLPHYPERCSDFTIICSGIINIPHQHIRCITSSRGSVAAAAAAAAASAWYWLQFIGAGSLTSQRVGNTNRRHSRPVICSCCYSVPERCMGADFDAQRSSRRGHGLGLGRGRGRGLVPRLGVNCEVIAFRLCKYINWI